MRGGVDWGNIQKAGHLVRLDDMAELAVRLGSIVNYDRRGDIIFAEDFEISLARWEVTKVGANVIVTLATERPRSGAVSVNLVVPGAAGKEASLTRSLGVVTSDQLGLELSFTIEAGGISVRPHVTIITGGRVYTAGIDYNYGVSTLSYYDATAGWTEMATGVEVLLGAGVFNTMKLIFSPVTGTYTRLLFNGSIYDMAGIPCYSAASSASPVVTVVVNVISRIGALQAVYVDDVILTQNEI